MEQTLPPLVSDEQMETEANEWREGERGVTITHRMCFFSGAEWMRSECEADRAKTREVVQALVDALRNADRYGNFRNDGPYHFNPDSDQHALQKFEAAAIALAKSQLQIEPTKP